ncbi:MAG: LysR family transcriptional regulator [Sphingomonadaceae bacterium]
MNVRHLSFRLLQVYVQVVQLGSLSAAARALHLTQPTVSLQIKRLADAVGTPLFEPREGQQQLSAAGEELYAAACDVLGRFDDFSSWLARADAGTTGHVRVAVVTTAKYVMPRILGPFYKQFPQITVTLSVGNRAQILNRFEQQQDDLYLFSHPPSGSHVQAARILRNPLCMIAPPDHWSATRSALTMADLAGERFLVREPGSATRLMFESWLSSQGMQLGQVMQIESNEAIRLSVASGLGLSVISAHTLSEGREAVAQLPVAGFPLDSNWYLVARNDRRMPAAALQLVDFIASQLQQCVEPAWVAPDLSMLHRQFAGVPQEDRACR